MLRRKLERLAVIMFAFGKFTNVPCLRARILALTVATRRLTVPLCVVFGLLATQLLFPVHRVHRAQTDAAEILRLAQALGVTSQSITSSICRTANEQHPPFWPDKKNPDGNQACPICQAFQHLDHGLSPQPTRFDGTRHAVETAGQPVSLPSPAKRSLSASWPHAPPVIV